MEISLNTAVARALFAARAIPMFDIALVALRALFFAPITALRPKFARDTDPARAAVVAERFVLFTIFAARTVLRPVLATVADLTGAALRAETFAVFPALRADTVPPRLTTDVDEPSPRVTTLVDVVRPELDPTETALRGFGA